MKQLVVEKSRVISNIEKVKARAGEHGAAVYAVVKGDAYGLGLLEMAGLCRQCGITRFALVEIEDAITLRENGYIAEEILMMRSTVEPRYLEALCEYNLVGTIGSHDVALAMSGMAQRRGTVIEAHIEIDTGMGRGGFLPSDTGALVSIYKNIPNLALTGIYTHFSRAFSSEKATRRQTDDFKAVLDRLRAAAIEPGLVHAANSSALFNYDFCMFDAVRVGSALTGRIATKRTFGLQKAGYLACGVSEVSWLPKGCTVGYGAAYKARKTRRIAVLPVGYMDGFCVEKSRDTYRFRDVVRYVLSAVKRGIFRQRMTVLIGGVKVKSLGHIGMCHTVVDVTNIDCSAGDIAVIEVNPLMIRGITRRYE